jgi:hypothetical protein
MNVIIFLLHIVFISIVSFFLWKRQPAPVKKVFWIGLLLKILSGTCLGLLYIHYYNGGDTLTYFHDANILAGYAIENPLDYLRFLWSDYSSSFQVASQLHLEDARALFFAKTVSLLSLATANNYWLISAYFSLISFLGILYLLRSIHEYLPSQINNVAIAFLFFPSVAFWSSGLIKESVAFASLSYLTGLFVRGWFLNALRISDCLVGLLCLWLLWGLKYYYAAVFIPVVVACVVYRFILQPALKPKTFLTEICIWLAIFIVPLFLISFASPNFYLDRFLQVMVENNHAYNLFSEPNDLIRYYDLQPTPKSIFLNSPIALLSGIFRPCFLEADNIFQVIAAMENLALLVLTITAIIQIKQLPIFKDRILIMAVIVYIILLCVCLALSTPNFGTLSRYRIGFLPFYVWLILMNNPFYQLLASKWNSLFHR